MAHTRAAVLAYPAPEILRIEHSQANPLKLSLAWDPASEMPASLTLRAEIHPSRSVPNNAVPLAAVTLVVTDADTQPWTLEFSSQQTNLDLIGKDRRDFVLTISGIESSTRLYTLADADLVLLRHPCSQLVPAAVSPLLYATAEDLDAIDARVTDIEETGGGGGATNLTRTLAPATVTILSDTGTDATIPAADGTNAGVLTSASWSKLNDLPTADTFGDLAFRNTVGAAQIASGAVGTFQIEDAAVTVVKTSGFGSIATQASNNVTITGGAITGTTVSGITFTNGGSGALTVTGTASVAGATSGTNTGDQTITLTGDVTGSGTGSFAATLANSGVTAGSYTRATITVDAKGRVTAASPNSAGEINGSAGTTDNGIVRADGTSGSAVQGSSIVIDDIDTTTQQNVAIRNVDPAANSALVLTPKGTGAFIVGPKPDGTTTGGNVRGTRAIDLQSSRGGNTQVASAADSFVCGANNTASGSRAGVFSGESNTASASQSACLAGQINAASASQAVTIGGSNALANRIGMQASANGAFSSNGDAQRGFVVMRRQTTDATQTDLTMDGAAAAASGAITSSNRFVLLNNQTVMVDVFVVCRSASGTDDAGFHRRALITRDANAGTTAIVGLQTVGVDLKTAGATLWDATLAVETTYGSLRVLVTGAAATNINWLAEIQFREVIRA